MRTRPALWSLPAAQQELSRLHEAGQLEPIDDEFNLGILRGLDGNDNIGLLNFGLPNAKLAPILGSSVLRATAVEFNLAAHRILGNSYILKGYAGTSTEEGAVSTLHAHDTMSAILNTVIGTGQGDPPVTTMFYTGEAPAVPYRDRPMTEAIAQLGRSSFFQPHEGQLVEFEPTDFHGEPPLPVGTPRMLLVAYSYEE